MASMRHSIRRLDEELKGIPRQRYRLFLGTLGLVWLVVGIAALWLGFWPSAGAIVVAVGGAVGALLSFWNFVAESRHGN